MRSYAGPLRAARADIIPRVPELAPGLKGNRFAILEALEDAFVERGHDPEAVPGADWNKVERHTIAGFAAREQAEYLVIGKGSAARFNDFKVNHKGERGANAFNDDLKATQASGARYVTERFKHGDDAEHSWWGIAARRYRHLGFAAARPKLRMNNGFVISLTTPLEGVFLHSALRTNALRGASLAYLALIKEATAEMSKVQRLQAAHDLANIVTSVAGLHFLELMRGVQKPDFIVVENEETGRYQAVHRRQNNIRNAFPRLPRLPNVTLKCPAHVRSDIPNAVNAKSEPISQPVVERPEPTPLQNLFHAAINAAADYDYDIL